MKTAILLFVLLIAAAAAHVVWYYPLLPDTVASHFGVSGQPDGWTSKQVLVGIYAAVAATLALTLGGFALLKIPVALVNVPHRDYWLAPERRQASLAAVRAILLWIGNVTLAFLIATMHLTFRINLGLQVDLGPVFWWLLDGYLLVMLGMFVGLLKRFGRPDPAG